MLVGPTTASHTSNGYLYRPPRHIPGFLERRRMGYPFRLPFPINPGMAVGSVEKIGDALDGKAWFSGEDHCFYTHDPRVLVEYLLCRFGICVNEIGIDMRNSLHKIGI